MMPGVSFIRTTPFLAIMAAKMPTKKEHKPFKANNAFVRSQKDNSPVESGINAPITRRTIPTSMSMFCVETDFGKNPK